MVDHRIDFAIAVEVHAPRVITDWRTGPIDAEVADIVQRTIYVFEITDGGVPNGS